MPSMLFIYSSGYFGAKKRFILPGATSLAEPPAPIEIMLVSSSIM